MNRQSPYRNQAGVRNQSNSILRNQGQANTDSEIYSSNQPQSIHARPGPTGIGKGTKNAVERREQEKLAILEVESQKKAVLDKLNKI